MAFGEMTWCHPCFQCDSVSMTVNPFHLAIIGRQRDVVKLLLDYAKKDSKQAIDGWEMINKKTKVSFP